jgi:PTH1 family peptidyl-tRNA hydrolase
VTIKAIFGLGNKARSSSLYRGTRHNTGSDCIDYILQTHQVSECKYNIPNSQAFMYKPGQYLVNTDCYMNESGVYIALVMKYLNLHSDEIVVIHDEIELNYGVMKFKYYGSHKGHNGIKNIISHLHTDAFIRLRIGIGKNYPLDQYVLDKHSANEICLIQDCYTKIVSILDNIFSPNLPLI